MPTRGLYFGAVLGFLAVASSLFWLWMQSRDRTIFRENGPMENCQVACLACGVLLLVWAISRTASAAQRVLLFGFVLLYSTLIVLELDLREFHLERLNKWFNGWRRNTWLGLAWGIGAILFWRTRQSVWQLFWTWLRGPAGMLLLISGACWLSASLFDKLKPFGSHEANFMAEELIEVNAAFFMFISAALTARSQNWLQAQARQVGLKEAFKAEG